MPNTPRLTYNLEPVKHQDDQWVIRDHDKPIIHIDDSEHGAASVADVADWLNKLDARRSGLTIC